MQIGLILTGMWRVLSLSPHMLSQGPKGGRGLWSLGVLKVFFLLSLEPEAVFSLAKTLMFLDPWNPIETPLKPCCEN